MSRPPPIDWHPDRCPCGRPATIGTDVFLLQGRLGTWRCGYCAGVMPAAAAVPASEPPAPVPPPPPAFAATAQGDLFG